MKLKWKLRFLPSPSWFSFTSSGSTWRVKRRKCYRWETQVNFFPKAKIVYLSLIRFIGDRFPLASQCLELPQMLDNYFWIIIALSVACAFLITCRYFSYVCKKNYRDAGVEIRTRSKKNRPICRRYLFRVLFGILS